MRPLDHAAIACPTGRTRASGPAPSSWPRRPASARTPAPCASRGREHVAAVDPRRPAPRPATRRLPPASPRRRSCPARSGRPNRLPPPRRPPRRGRAGSTCTPSRPAPGRRWRRRRTTAPTPASRDRDAAAPDARPDRRQRPRSGRSPRRVIPALDPGDRRRRTPRATASSSIRGPRGRDRVWALCGARFAVPSATMMPRVRPSTRRRTAPTVHATTVRPAAQDRGALAPAAPPPAAVSSRAGPRDPAAGRARDPHRPLGGDRGEQPPPGARPAGRVVPVRPRPASVRRSTGRRAILTSRGRAAAGRPRRAGPGQQLQVRPSYASVKDRWRAGHSRAASASRTFCADRRITLRLSVVLV